MLRALVPSLFFLSLFACGSSSSTNAAAPEPDPEPDASASRTRDASTARTDAGAEAGSPSSPATGAVGGFTFTFAFGIAYPRPVGQGPGYEVFLSDKPIDCSRVTLDGATTVNIGFPGDPPAASTYTLASGAGGVAADFNRMGPACSTLYSVTSLRGSAVVTRFDATTAEGTLDVTFRNRDGSADGTVRGSYTARVCAAFPVPTCPPG